MTDQLALFDPPQPTAATLRFVTVCPWCGEVVDISPPQDPGARWDHVNTWSYIAQQRHNHDRHPERDRD